MMRRVVPVVLMVAVAGWVDAVGLLYFLGHIGIFTAFMSGNLTRVVTSFAAGEGIHGLLYASVIACFAAGVLVGRMLNDGRRAREASALFVEALLLAAAAATTHTRNGEAFVLMLMAASMGCNNVAMRAARGWAPRTFVTGTLVSLVTGLADALAGRAAWSELGAPAVTLAALMGGATGGVLLATVEQLDVVLLVPAVTVALIALALATRLIPTHESG
ncbi:MAG: DUF1275 domain-containing protein [Geminicoccaceae bacterium]|nr:DUF1275 domain-containing protein [Geminicoccaceae bacterium]